MKAVIFTQRNTRKNGLQSQNTLKTTTKSYLWHTQDEYYNIEDEETDEDIIERRNDNLDELKCAIQVVIGEMSDYEVEEDEIEEEKKEA